MHPLSLPFGGLGVESSFIFLKTSAGVDPPAPPPGGGQRGSNQGVGIPLLLRGGIDSGLSGFGIIGLSRSEPPAILFSFCLVNTYTTFVNTKYTLHN